MPQSVFFLRKKPPHTSLKTPKKLENRRKRRPGNFCRSTALRRRSTRASGPGWPHVIQFKKHGNPGRTTRLEEADPGAEAEGGGAQITRAGHRWPCTGLDAASGHGADCAHALLQSLLRLLQ